MEKRKRQSDVPIPWRSLYQDESFYRLLDPGIRFAVRVLHAHGVDTHQSCQGGKGHAYDVPSIDFANGTLAGAEGFGALWALAGYGLPVNGLNYHWRIVNGVPVECFWRVTFSRTMEDRADGTPTFIYGARAT